MSRLGVRTEADIAERTNGCRTSSLPSDQKIRATTEVGVVLKRQDGEIADRILRLPRNIILVRLADGIVINARGFVGHRLLGHDRACRR
jgi:hypothetical protein